MSRVASDVLKERRSPQEWPEKVIFDFNGLSFINPTGVVFLHNMIRWLQAKKCTVYFSNINSSKRCLEYLKDSKFFSAHLPSQSELIGTVRSTTRPLIEVKHEKSFGWIDLELMSWLAAEACTSLSALYGLKNSITEIFNNIIDRSRHDIGSVFCQHFPNRQEIIISISDMGIGIPQNVRKICPNLSDSAAIIQATKEKFTSQSIETNAGMGLDQLMRAVVCSLGGAVTIYSGKGIVRFNRRGDEAVPYVLPQVGYCPGTTLELKIDTRVIPFADDELEDLEW